MSVCDNFNILWKILWELISNFFVSVVYITYSLYTQVIAVSSENNSKKKSLNELNKTRFYFQFSSIAQLCLTLCDPMNHTMPCLPVHHQLAESTQTHVHWVGDAIQPSHPLSSPSPPALSLYRIRVFSNETALCINWPKYWSSSFSISLSNEHSGLISFRMDWLDLLAVPGALESSPTPLFKSINS